jgi:hypothetical protein
MATAAEVRSLLAAFVSGADCSIATAGRLEVALEELFGDEEPYASLTLALASYRPGGGEFLHDEHEIRAMMRPILEQLEARRYLDEG